MFHIGAHLSISKGYEAIGREAVSIGANTFQFFTRNPRGSKAKAIDPEDVRAYLDFAVQHGIGKILAHAPYTLNPCSGEERTREFALEVMEDDLKRMEYLPGNYYNFHPGSHVGQGIEAGIPYIVNTLNTIMKPEQTTIILLETMAGKGSEIGRTFGELRQILEGAHYPERLGVCLDTCHVYDAGYDLVNDLDGVLQEFDSIIGLDKLYAIHLNDSKNPMSSGKDRHERLGEGVLGWSTFEKLINHPRLRDLLFCLETPNEPEGYAEEIAKLKELYHE